MGTKFSDLTHHQITPPIMTFKITCPENLTFWKMMKFYTFITDMTNRFIPDTNMYRHLHSSGMIPNFEFVRIIYKNEQADMEIFSEATIPKDLLNFKAPLFVTESTWNEIFIFLNCKPMNRVVSPMQISLARMNKACRCDIDCIHYFKGHPTPVHNNAVNTYLHFWFDGNL